MKIGDGGLRIAPIAHGMKQDDIVAPAGAYAHELAQCQLIATDTPGAVPVGL
jgi:methylglyoxal synthase